MYRSTLFKRILMCVFLFFILLVPLVFADSDTFNTMVVTVTPGIDDFGLGLFPVGTRWQYYTDRYLIPNLTHPTSFVLDFEFEVANTWTDNRFSWKDGSPKWNTYPYKIDGSLFMEFDYFNPRSRIYFNVGQGFGVNKKSGSGPMFRVSAELNTRFAMALEKIEKMPSEESLIFTHLDGTPRYPFTTDSSIPGFPWLQGNRRLLNNRLTLSVDFNHISYMGMGASDGVTANINLCIGPNWLGNDFGGNGKTSDFWKTGISFSQNLNLLKLQQGNGLNWISINLGHSNSFSYVGGPVVPEDMIPRDRFRASLTDYLYLQFTGPQFIAWDCYTEFSLGLSNGLYFGHVVNEISQQSTGIELYSGISGVLHLRLFGFMHFDYRFGYDFAGGIWQSAPYWYQQNQFRFYISL